MSWHIINLVTFPFFQAEQEVFDWLSELKLTGYFDAFKTHGFDMISMQAVTPEDLNFLDIQKTGHRKKLLSEIAKLSYAERLPNNKPVRTKHIQLIDGLPIK